MNYQIDDIAKQIRIEDGDASIIIYGVDGNIIEIIKEQEERLNKFVDLLITMCFDHDYEDVTDNDDWYRLKACEYDGWQEVMCRWLYKFGYIDKKDNVYYTKEDKNEDTTIN